MNLRKLTGAAVAAALALPMFVSGANAYELVIPSMDYRTGPFAPNGIVFANGWSDYLTLLNERDGGINGVKIKNVTCETGYNTKKGVECYEKIKGTPPSGALLVQPLSTGITYQLIPKASVTKFRFFPWATAELLRPMARFFRGCLTFRRLTGARQPVWFSTSPIRKAGLMR